MPRARRREARAYIADPGSPRMVLTSEAREHFAGLRPEQIRREVESITAGLQELHANAGNAPLPPAQQGEWDQLKNLRNAGIALIEQHNQMALAFQRGGMETPFGQREETTMSGAAGGALRAIERLDRDGTLPPERADAMDEAVRSSPQFAKEFEALASDHYAKAFAKVLSLGEARASVVMTGEEREAMARAMSASVERAMAEGSPASGGFGVPVALDPSIILTAQGSGNPVMRLARVVDVAGSNIWKGVSSAGVSWSFDAEAAEVSDDSPTLAQPSITVFTARGFVPFSIEVSEDYGNFAGEMSTLLAEGYDELLSDKLTRGSGSGEPQGILTALSANTNVRVTITTGGTIGAADPYKVWGALPEKYRGRANWMMSVDVNNKIRQLGNVNVYHAYTVSLPAGAADQLMNSAVYTSAYMPDSTANTTATNGLAIVGTWSNFVVARRAGMRVELVPTLLGLTSNRPTGQRGFFAWSRIGAGSTNDLGFRLLCNF